MGPWGIVMIKTDGTKENYIFKRREGETWKTMYPRVKEFAEDLMDKHPNYEVVVVSRAKAFPAPQNWGYGVNSRRPYEFWCPHCRRFVFFVEDYKTGYRHCPICHLSDQDFHVKFQNQLHKSIKDRGEV